MAGKYFWLKERHNPQLGIYYVACGRITTKEAKTHEISIYGDNYMHKFETEKEYEAEIDRLKKTGKSVH